jgi:hypothetical protein
MTHGSWLESLEEAVADVELDGTWAECGFDYAYGSVEGFKSEMGYEINSPAEIKLEWISEGRPCFEEIETSRSMTKKVYTPDLRAASILVTVQMLSLSARRHGWSGYKWNATYAVSNT